MGFWGKTRWTLEKFKIKCINLAKIEIQGLKSLKKKNEIVISKSDKRNCSAVMEKLDYLKKINIILNCETCEQFNKVSTHVIETKIKKLLSRNKSDLVPVKELTPLKVHNVPSEWNTQNKQRTQDMKNASDRHE
jgi:hypothetical protein